MDHETYIKIEPRLRLFYVLLGLMFLYLIGGLAWVQIFSFSEHTQRQVQQNYRRILIPGPRGDIYDREGRLLVGNRPLFNAVVYLNELRKEFRQEYFQLVRTYRESGIKMDRGEVNIEARRRVVQRYLNQINRILGTAELVESKEIERHFTQNLLLPLPLLTDLTPDEYARLTEQLPVDSPVQIVAESARYYPFGESAAHTLGFVVSAQEESETQLLPGEELRTFSFKGKVGRTGIESAFDAHLQGEAGFEIWVVDPSNFQHERKAFSLPVKGHDLTTAIDLDLQLAAEEAMGDKTGAVVAIDVKTGEVLALASQPSFDLNDLTPYLSFAVDKDIRDRGAWINRATQGLYPPGSTFKLVTAVAAEIKGLVAPDTVVNCPGFYRVGSRNFPCHNRSGHGPQTPEQAIANSCNVYFYKVGVEMGIEHLAAVARMFGLDRETNIELPGESTRTVVPDPAYKRRRFSESWFPGDTANTSIGQGFLLQTPLQLAAFTASLARGEVRTDPTLVKQPDGPDSIQQHAPIPITDAQHQRIMNGMRLAALAGTARLAQRDVSAHVAGKTGTAQVPIDGRMSTLAWFVGFAPFENPEIAIAVMIEGTDPGDQYHGGSTAAPIARNVFRTYFQKFPVATEEPAP